MGPPCEAFRKSICWHGSALCNIQTIYVLCMGPACATFKQSTYFAWVRFVQHWNSLHVLHGFAFSCATLKQSICFAWVRLVQHWNNIYVLHGFALCNIETIYMFCMDLPCATLKQSICCAWVRLVQHWNSLYVLHGFALCNIETIYMLCMGSPCTTLKQFTCCACTACRLFRKATEPQVGVIEQSTQHGMSKGHGCVLLYQYRYYTRMLCVRTHKIIVYNTAVSHADSRLIKYLITRTNDNFDPAIDIHRLYSSFEHPKGNMT